MMEHAGRHLAHRQRSHVVGRQILQVSSSHCIQFGAYGRRIIKSDECCPAPASRYQILSIYRHCWHVKHARLENQIGSTEGIIIGDDVWIGIGARILDGVTVGSGCVIGAGAVVIRDIPDYAIAAGVPAKVIGNRKA